MDRPSEDAHPFWSFDGRENSADGNYNCLLGMPVSSIIEEGEDIVVAQKYSPDSHLYSVTSLEKMYGKKQRIDMSLLDEAKGTSGRSREVRLSSVRSIHDLSDVLTTLHEAFEIDLVDISQMMARR